MATLSDNLINSYWYSSPFYSVSLCTAVYRNVISKLTKDIMYLNLCTVKVAMFCTSMTRGLPDTKTSWSVEDFT
jgi:hypothetical protein